jgi:hypothetical protein
MPVALDAGSRIECRFVFARAYGKLLRLCLGERCMGGVVAALAGLALVALPAAAMAAELSLTSGVGYATGTYGAHKPTDTTLVPLAAKLRTGGWSFGVSTEWMSVNGPADIGEIDDLGGSTVSGSGGGKRDRQGFTDTHLSVRYALNHLAGGPLYLDAQAKAALSLGGDDVSGSRYVADAELGVEWRSMGAYVDLGRRFMNQSPVVDRHDAWAYAIGGWARLDRRTELGMWYVTHDAPVAGQGEPRKLGAYVSRDLNPAVRIAFTLYEGLSPASPGFGAGLRLTWRPDSDFRRRPFED